MRGCMLQNEGLWNSSVWDSLYFKIKNLLVTKVSKRVYSIVNTLNDKKKN
jgi:hypothetical protein